MYSFQTGSSKRKSQKTIRILSIVIFVLAVALIGFEEAPVPPSLAWNVVYVPIVLITLAIGLAFYPSVPDMVPTHFDFAGNVNQ